ncbi:MAG: GNAT family N-acetyltransferase [Tistlia sp.]|uniref:N-acetyltransferase family protein n=1 Tax=Tistlia sp. TaxID=3057121 RepID=UPI0034A35030
MDETLHIRPAADRDLDRLAAMMVELHRHLALPPSPATPALLWAQLSAEPPPFACLVAERTGTLVGYAAYCDFYNSDYMARGFWLCDLFVDPALRSAGAGRALLAELSRIAVEQERVSIWWGVHRTNLRAIGFYDRIGAGDFQVDLRELETDALQALAAEARAGAGSAT